MHGLNGRADLVGSPIQLGDFLPERREVMLNGQKYLAWVVVNRRFPRSVQAELDQARNRYMRVVGPMLAPADAGEQEGVDREEQVRMAADRERALDQADGAFAQYVTAALVALLPGLSEPEADMLDQETAQRVLVELGYFSPPPSSEPVAEGRGDAGPLTGDSSSPGSPTSTPAAAQESS